MITPARPPNEAKRLSRLRSLEILDTPAEERFDRLTRMARRIFRVPIALVSLVDENRQWFKSNTGLTIFETPRDISFCGHAILGDDVFIIPDSTQDPRFAENPLVLHEPHIRFYAGCPLRALDGSKLGTLCIIDHEPRTLTQEEIEILKDLARMAEHELAAIEMATLDELTMLSNRRGFIATARHTLSLCRRQSLPASLVFMDLDSFKAINDQFGHGEGDYALRSFSERMRQTFRKSDLCARIGGDEFAVLLTNASRETAEAVTSRFHRSVANLSQQVRRGYDIAFSYGIVEYDPAAHDSIEALVAAGDASMYAQKVAQRATSGRVGG